MMATTCLPSGQMKAAATPWCQLKTWSTRQMGTTRELAYSELELTKYTMSVLQRNAIGTLSQRCRTSNLQFSNVAAYIQNCCSRTGFAFLVPTAVHSLRLNWWPSPRWATLAVVRWSMLVCQLAQLENLSGI